MYPLILPVKHISLKHLGYPKYRIDVTGQVWWFHKGLNIWKTLSPGITKKKNYRRINLRDSSGAITSIFIHCLMLEAFVGPRPEGMECCHWDGNGGNNNLDNIRWDTPKNNSKDAIRLGRNHPGEKCGSSKLTDKIILRIRRLKNRGWTNRKLADKFNVSSTVIFNVYHRNTWKHV
jgi:hypothetical protein